MDSLQLPGWDISQRRMSGSWRVPSAGQGTCWPPRSSARLCCCSCPPRCCWWRGGCEGTFPSGCWLCWGSTVDWPQTTVEAETTSDWATYFLLVCLLERHLCGKLTAFVKDIPASPISFFVFLSGVWRGKGKSNELQMPHLLRKWLINGQKSVYKWIQFTMQSIHLNETGRKKYHNLENKLKPILKIAATSNQKALLPSVLKGIMCRFRQFREPNLFKSDVIWLLLCPGWSVFG